MAFDAEALERALAPLPPCGGLAVGFSGGMDSSTLLHCLAGLRRAGRLPAPLRALHVNHGLDPDAGRRQAFCERACAELGVGLASRAAEVSRSPSLENAARTARYAAFGELLDEGEALLLAHHQDDQLETLLLRLLRGAGPAGLAGMPRSRPVGRGFLYRPLLDVPRSDLAAYARRCRLAWVEDPGNADERSDRNYCRRRVLPAVTARWPAWRGGWSRSLALLGDAAGALEELADADLARAADGDALDVGRLRALGPARRRNALRRWTARLGLADPGWRRLNRLVAEILEGGPGGELAADGYVFRRHRNRLWVLARPAPAPGPPPRLLLSVPGPVPLPGNGALVLAPAARGGLARDMGELEVRYRAGGESLRLPGRPAKTLKSLLRERGVAPWIRERTPLLYHRGSLVCVPGLGVAAGALAGPGEAGVAVGWRPPELAPSGTAASE